MYIIIIIIIDLGTAQVADVDEKSSIQRTRTKIPQSKTLERECSLFTTHLSESTLSS